MTAIRRLTIPILSLLVPLACATSVPASDSTAPTFNRDIAPIIHRNCAGCHREGEIGPFPLITYHDVRKRAQMIRQVTGTRYMPPWHADPDYSSFVQERILSDREIEAIAQWVETGAPEGTGAVPPLRLVPASTNLGDPDMVLGMRESYEVRGDNRDDWRTFAIPVNLEADMDIKAVVVRPGNRRVVHHAVLYLDESGAGLELDRSSSGYGFSSWQGMKIKISDVWPPYVPGMEPIVYPRGIGKRLPRSAVLLLSMHYAPTPRTETDQTRVELYFADEPPQFHAVPAIINEGHLVQESLFVPAGETRRFEERRTFNQPITILAVFPHMHYRGKTFRAYATLPDSEDTVPLLKIDAWDFNWQGAYTFREPVRLPAGATIHVHALFDNTAENPANPVLPPVDVRYGKGSYDEMLKLGLELLRPVSLGATGDRRLAAVDATPGSTAPRGEGSAEAGRAASSRAANPESAGRVTRDAVGGKPAAALERVAESIRSPSNGPSVRSSQTFETALEPSLEATRRGSERAGEVDRPYSPWLLTGCIALGVCCLLIVRLACNALRTVRNDVR